jgi:hypothetical protein
MKVEDDLDEVKLNNSLADSNVTEKTHLVEDVSTEAVPRPGFWRNTAAAALIAIVVLTFAAAMTVQLKPTGAGG